MNPSEGRVPVSWNECADWLEWFGWESVTIPSGIGMVPTGLWAGDIRSGISTCPISDYRLLPPPGLVAAPEGMDGGGWLGQGKDVPDGWKWRHMTDSGWLQSLRPTFGDAVVQCRPPVRVRAVVEVPLTRLVGRTIEGRDGDLVQEVILGPTAASVVWRASRARDWSPFPDGSLDLDTGLVRVYAEGDEK